MNKHFSALLILLVFLTISGITKIPPGVTKHQNPLQNPAWTKVQYTLFNVNNIAGWIGWDGTSGNNPYTGNAGVIYPRGMGNVIFHDGLIWGGLINDGQPTLLRVGGQTSNTGTASGRIISQGVAQNPDDPQVRIYRIRRDYLTVSDAELLSDAAEFFNVSINQVTQDQIDTIRANYSRDWQDWPVAYGAPFYDNNLNGFYEPGLGEEPGLRSADQVIWFVCNDLDPSLTYFLYGSPPIGLELQVTFWGYKVGGPFGQSSFHRYRLINKSGFPIDSMFIAQWSDPDLSSASDDLVGCDSLLNVGLCYNSNPVNPVYNPPPAIGYVMLQGPIVSSPGDTAFFNFKKIPNFRNLSMTSFGYWSAGNPEWGDPDLQDYDGTLQWYNILNGNISNTNIANPTPFTHRAGPYQGRPTKFPLNGDPVTGSGDVDGSGGNFPAADRRMAMVTGPFDMAPGDTQEVVTALVGGQGTDYLNSITEMKKNIRTLRNFYQRPIAIPEGLVEIEYPTNTASFIKVRMNLNDFNNVITSRINFNPEIGSETGFNLDLFDDGQHYDSLAGDHIWGNSLTVSNRKYPFAGECIVNWSAGLDTIPGILSHLQLRPTPELENWQVIWENGLQDDHINNNELVHLGFSIQNQDAINSIDSIEVSNLVYTMSYFNPIPAGGSLSTPDFYTILTGPVQGNSLNFSLIMVFDHHLVSANYQQPVVPWSPPSSWGDTLEVQSLTGTKLNIVPIVADPGMLTGHLYLISFYSDVGTQELRYNITDRSNGSVKVTAGIPSTSAYYPHPVVDGILYVVKETLPDFIQFTVVANANGHLDPPDIGCFGFNASGFPWLFNARYPDGTDRPTAGVQQSTNSSTWGIHTGMTSTTMPFDFDYFKARVTRSGSNWPFIMPYDFELRFTAAGSQGIFWTTTNTIVNVPFELWNIGMGTPDFTLDDYRMVPRLNDEDGNEVFNLVQNDHSISGGVNDPYTDWIYWNDPDDKSPGQSGYNAVVGSSFNSGISDEVMARMVVVNWNGGDVTDPTWPANVNALMPETGTIFRIESSKPNFPGDSLVVNSASVSITVQDQLPDHFEIYQNYPNPFNPVTTIRFNLPSRQKTELEIFDVLGQKVCTLLNKQMEAGVHRIQWNGQNDQGKPIGSGIYFYRITAGDYVKTMKAVLLK